MIIVRWSGIPDASAQPGFAIFFSFIDKFSNSYSILFKISTIKFLIYSHSEFSLSIKLNIIDSYYCGGTNVFFFLSTQVKMKLANLGHAQR